LWRHAFACAVSGAFELIVRLLPPNPATAKARRAPHRVWQSPVRITS